MARDRGDIEALVRRAYTGNRHKDLCGFSLDEFEEADRCWHEEAQRRYEATELRLRAGLRIN